tara:strand:+ start:561 stop:845 length:285 start_codon:yes stop_codon:yes gene_type:complete
MGTFSPSRRHRRSMRLSFICQPASQQSGDPTVSISTILSRQFDHVRHKAFFICAAPWLTSLCRSMLTKYTANSALGNHQLAKHLIDASTTTCGA